MEDERCIFAAQQTRTGVLAVCWRCLGGVLGGQI